MAGAYTGGVKHATAAVPQPPREGGPAVATAAAAPLATRLDIELLFAALRLELSKSRRRLAMWVAGSGGLILAAQLATAAVVLARG